MPNNRRLATFAAVVVLTGCGADGAAPDEPDAAEPTASAPIDPSTTADVTEESPPASSPPSGAPEPISTVEPTTAPTTTQQGSADFDPLVVAAMGELAVAQGRTLDEIELVIFERVTWRSGALGCPQPGLSYTQALVDGYRIVLSLDGTRYFFHGASGGPPFLCDDPQDPAPGGVGGDT